jgi:hypothetical protein
MVVDISTYFDLHCNVRGLIPLRGKNIFDKLLCQVRAFGVWMSDGYGTNAWIISIAGLWDLNICTTPILNSLYGCSRFANNEANIGIRNLDCDEY